MKLGLYRRRFRQRHGLPSLWDTATSWETGELASVVKRMLSLESPPAYLDRTAKLFARLPPSLHAFRSVLLPHVYGN